MHSGCRCYIHFLPWRVFIVCLAYSTPCGCMTRLKNNRDWGKDSQSDRDERGSNCFWVSCFSFSSCHWEHKSAFSSQCLFLCPTKGCAKGWGGKRKMCVCAGLGISFSWSVPAEQMITVSIEIARQMCLLLETGRSPAKVKRFLINWPFSGQGPVIYKCPPITVWRYG